MDLIGNFKLNIANIKLKCYVSKYLYIIHKSGDEVLVDIFDDYNHEYFLY